MSAAENGPAAGGASFDAVILAGGRGTRLGGVDKPAIAVAGRTLVAGVVSAATRAGARQVIIVGPPRPELRRSASPLRAVREEPPGAGPVPALRAGLAEVTAPWLVLLAADLPFLRDRYLVRLLAAATSAAAPGAVTADESGRPQWLVSCWQVTALRAALRDYRDSSLHGLFLPMRRVTVGPDPDEPEPPPWFDVDTPEDLRRAGSWCGGCGPVLPPDEGQYNDEHTR